MTWKAALMVSVLVLGTGAAQAQTKKELVAKLVQLQQGGVESIGRQLATQTSQRVLQAASQAMQRVPADKREAVGKEVQAEVKKFYDEIEPVLRKRASEIGATTVAPVYEERFSEDELKTVIAWLESPVSKKFQQVDAEVGNSLAQKVVADTRSVIEPKLKALEGNLAKRMGLPAPSAASAAGGKK